MVKQDYIGKIRAAHMTVSLDAFPDTMPGRYDWAFKAENFCNVLSVYAAHFGIELFQAIGYPKKLTAVMEIQFPYFTIAESGEQVFNLAYLYDAFASDKKNGTSTASNFEDAIKQHYFIDQIVEAFYNFMS